MNSKRFLACKKARTDSLKTHFFDDVCIEDETLQDDILDWMSRLKYKKNISINKFSDLLSEFKEIVFPITVSGIKHHLKITDSLGNEYYLNYFQSKYSKLNEYSIGRHQI